MISIAIDTKSIKYKGRLSRLFILVLIISLLLLSYGRAQPNGNHNEDIWESLDSGYPEGILWDIDFINASHGWTVGQSSEGVGNGIILATTDRGNTWNIQLENSEDWFNQITITDGNIIWIASLGNLVFSEDYGSSWTVVEFDDIQSLFSTIAFSNGTHGWAATNKILFNTNDSGVTWNKCKGWIFDDTLRRIYFHSNEAMDAIGFDGIYQSTDGGYSWEKNFDKGGWAIEYSDSLHGWAIADDMLAKTSDDMTWQEIPIPSGSPIPGFRDAYLTDIQFYDESHGWIIGSEPPIMYSSDGGNTWYAQGVDIGLSRLLAVDFINETHGWASGYHGKILRTQQGNSIGTRLWQGATDPLFLSIIGGGFIIIAVVVAIRKIRRPKGLIVN